MICYPTFVGTVLLMFSISTLIGTTAAQVIHDPPRHNVKRVLGNVDNHAIGDNEDYDVVEDGYFSDVDINVYAGSENRTFNLYISYDDGSTWNYNSSTIVPAIAWGNISLTYYLYDPTQNPPIGCKFDAISGAKVTYDEGSVERTLITVVRSQRPALNLSMPDGEFENGDTLTVECLMEWKIDLDWPENKQDSLVLYTTGCMGGPIVGARIPNDYPLAESEDDTTGLWEVYRQIRCSGSWGIVKKFVDFPATRLSETTSGGSATGIFVKLSALPSPASHYGLILDMTDCSFVYP